MLRYRGCHIQSEVQDAVALLKALSKKLVINLLDPLPTLELF